MLNETVSPLVDPAPSRCAVNPAITASSDPKVGTSLLTETPALLTAETAAQLCEVSLRTWRRLEAEGNVPNPVRVGGRIKRYRRTEVLAWVEAGCPSREQWESVRQVELRRRAK